MARRLRVRLVDDVDGPTGTNSADGEAAGAVVRSGSHSLELGHRAQVDPPSGSGGVPCGRRSADHGRR